MKRTLGIIGFMAGVLALVGIFTAWATVSGYGTSASASAWDSVTRATVMNQHIKREVWACLAFAGVILILVGALSALVLARTKITWSILAIGGLLAIAGAAWGFSAIPTGGIVGISSSYGVDLSQFGISVGHGVGVYLTLVGGVFGLSGIIGLLSG